MSELVWRIGRIILTGENFKYADKNVSQYHFVRNNSLINWPKTDPRISDDERPMTNRLCVGTAENFEIFLFLCSGTRRCVTGYRVSAFRGKALPLSLNVNNSWIQGSVSPGI
jgi:hypothetical protein